MRWLHQFPKAIMKPVLVRFTQWKKICGGFNELQENVITEVIDGDNITSTRDKGSNSVTINSTGGDSLPPTTGKSKGMVLSLVDTSLTKDWQFPMSHP